MLERFRLRSTGSQAADGIGYVARLKWPQCSGRLGTSHSSRAAAAAFRVFLTDYFWNNLWIAQLDEGDAVHVWRGIEDALASDEKEMMKSLGVVHEATKKLWRGSPPAAAMHMTIGQWFLSAAGVQDPDGNLAPSVGHTLFSEARSCLEAGLSNADN